MPWQTYLKGDSLSWLLEPEDPGVRYQALRYLIGLAPDDPQLIAARKLAHQSEPIQTVLKNMHPEGYWDQPGGGYSHKYRSGVWSLLTLAQMGASVDADERIARGTAYYLDHAFTPHGAVSYNGTPSGTFDCLQGNMCWALTELGVDDPRIDKAYEWMARTVTGEGIAPSSEKKAEIRYYVYKCGPNFACGPNQNKPCAWGAVKVMRAFGNWPESRRTPLIERAIQAGVEFIFSTDPLKADYPTPDDQKPNGDWWKLGFPIFYISDVLQIVEGMAALGYGRDPRLMNAMVWILDRQDADGRWPLEYTYTGKSWVNFGRKKQPNKWVTLRVLKVLKEINQN